VIKKLHANTGLMVNKDKSKAYLSKNCKNKSDLAAILGVSVSTMPTKYLGLPLTVSYIKARHFTPLIDKCRSKVEGWMLQKLSMAGRAELIKSVLHNTLSYWALSFKFPNSVIKEFERLFSKFSWNDKMHAWNWMDICKTKKEGGLGIRRLSDINYASGIRLFWRLCTSNTLWANWMVSNYLPQLDWETASASILHSGTWKFILVSKDKALQYMHKNALSNGWVWTGNNGREFTYKNCWDLIRTKYPSWPFYTITWYSNHCPKMTICLIRALHGKLLIKHFFEGHWNNSGRYMCIMLAGYRNY